MRSLHNDLIKLFSEYGIAVGRTFFFNTRSCMGVVDFVITINYCSSFLFNKYYVNSVRFYDFRKLQLKGFQRLSNKQHVSCVKSNSNNTCTLFMSGSARFNSNRSFQKVYIKRSFFKLFFLFIRFYLRCFRGCVHI